MDLPLRCKIKNYGGKNTQVPFSLSILPLSRIFFNLFGMFFYPILQWHISIYIFFFKRREGSHIFNSDSILLIKLSLMTDNNCGCTNCQNQLTT